MVEAYIDLAPPRASLNEVRPRRPEQCKRTKMSKKQSYVSMKSGLEGRNNTLVAEGDNLPDWVSMKSGLEGRNNAANKSKTLSGLVSQ